MSSSPAPQRPPWVQILLSVFASDIEKLPCLRLQTACSGTGSPCLGLKARAQGMHLKHNAPLLTNGLLGCWISPCTFFSHCQQNICLLRRTPLLQQLPGCFRRIIEGSLFQNLYPLQLLQSSVQERRFQGAEAKLQILRAFSQDVLFFFSHKTKENIDIVILKTPQGC